MKIEASITINEPGKESFAIITKDTKELLRISTTKPEVIISAAQNIIMVSCHEQIPEYGIVNRW